MGTAILFQTARVVPPNAGAFATELLSIFTAIIGGWSYPLIAVTAIAVMWSTVVALLDVVPRVTARLIDRLARREKRVVTSYTRLLIAQVVGVTLIMLLLLQSFSTFINFATSTAFITAPALAYYNYRAVKSADVMPQYEPSRALLIWHWAGFAALSAFALAFVIERLT